MDSLLGQDFSNWTKRKLLVYIHRFELSGIKPGAMHVGRFDLQLDPGTNCLIFHNSEANEADRAIPVEDVLAEIEKRPDNPYASFIKTLPKADTKSSGFYAVVIVGIVALGLVLAYFAKTLG